jgi:hypothetical protein
MDDEKLKIFDLSLKHNFEKGKTQKNLKSLEKKYGNVFKIKFNDMELIANLKKIKLLNGESPYILVHYNPKKTDVKDIMDPFSIYFFNIDTLKLKNISYIANIHKTPLYSGSELVKFCLEINRILGVKKTLIRDMADIKCNANGSDMNLSFIKILETYKTFYMKFGFDFEIKTYYYFSYKFTNKKDLLLYINNLINNIKNIKTKDIINEYEKTFNLINIIIKNNIIKNNKKKKLEIVYNDSNPTENKEYYLEKPEQKIYEIYDECINVLTLLNKYKYINYLYKILIKIFKNKCNEYTIIDENIINNERKKIIYNNIVIERKYVSDFKFLKNITNFMYSYSF